MPAWLENLLPILLLLLAVGIVLSRLPKVELGHDAQYLRRRVANWLPMGFAYAFLYMGRYNLNVAKRAFGDRMDNDAFSLIFGVGTWVYGLAFLLNGPLTDKFGGKRALQVGVVGALLCNALMGVFTAANYSGSLIPVFTVLYGLNMYFQSFGAVAIVKGNSAWFHVRERGTFGAIFGILISLGIYFAYDIGAKISANMALEWVFFIPALLLGISGVAVSILVKDSPKEAGLQDFNTGDASSGDDGPQLGAIEVFKLMLRSPVIVTIAFIEFCSGFLRQAIMQWYPIFVKSVGLEGSFFNKNWGMLLCVAGILGGLVAGVISDHVFQSRRGPVAGFLYGAMLLGAGLLTFTYATDALGPIVVVMSMCIIGVHGMLSGTASQDFGGKKNAGIATGIIDGFVYGGTGFMSLCYYYLLPTGEKAHDVGNWWLWPVSMIPMSIVGLALCARIWNAKPAPKGAAAH